ncbi:MAG: putative oxidoreductase [Acidimicrobiales bacterium]|nr:putative oxidoreductase [Acidimicrobiales bacterium]
MPGSRQSLWFVSPGNVEVRDEQVGAPGPGEVLVESIVSAISPGTEMLVYRGHVPADMPLDASIPGLTDTFSYPVKYGYATVGRVTELGARVSPEWQDVVVFSLHPHESHFLASLEELVPVPAGLTGEHACLFPHAEAAVSFLMDGRPVVGEDVAVFGQGVVGLMTTAFLARVPLSRLVAVDLHPLRRERSVELGAHTWLDVAALDSMGGVFDLAYELSGSPAALDQAIAVTGFNGRVVIGSWYGDKRVELGLGRAFHRSRITLASSQVSTIDPQWQGRWDKARRAAVAWRMLAGVDPGLLVTHRFPFSEAAAAYELVDRHPEETVQVLLEYEV